MKNYGDRREEGVIRRGRRPRRVTPSDISKILHMIRKPNSIIVLLFIQIFDSVRLGLSSSANILQIADVALRVVFLLFLLCF